jgi:hypothetical protein
MGLLVGTMFYPVITNSNKHRLIIWGCKIAALPLAIVLFVVLIRNFYTSDPYAGMRFSYSYNLVTLTLETQLALGADTCPVSPYLLITIAKGEYLFSVAFLY